MRDTEKLDCIYTVPVYKMSRINAHGFCDVNISNVGINTKKMVISALKLGYETIALNTEVSDEVVTTSKNKKGSQTPIPSPSKFSLNEKELKELGIRKIPKIYSRLTITFSDPSSPFLHKSKEIIGQYDIIAYKPMTEAAFKHLCQSNVDVDIIHFEVDENRFRISRKLLNFAINSDIYFEICYGPCIRNSIQRQKTIQFAHELHCISRSLNVILTSGAQNSQELRNPYDVSNLGILFGLSPAGSKAAVSKVPSDLIHCAHMRRTGASRCSAQIEIFDQVPKKGKYTSLIDLEKAI